MTRFGGIARSLTRPYSPPLVGLSQGIGELGLSQIQVCQYRSGQLKKSAVYARGVNRTIPG